MYVSVDTRSPTRARIAGNATTNVKRTASRHVSQLMRGALPTSASVSRVALIACAVIGLAALAAPSHAKAQSATKGAAKASTAQPTTAATPPSVKPSRLASKGCKWEAASGAGLRAWVERCDYRDRKIDLFFKGHQLMQRYSDGDAPEALVDVLDMLPNETQSAAMTRVFASHTDAKTRAKCVLAPYKDGGKPPAGAQFYTFAPNAAYAKTLAKNKSTDIPDPPCGEWGAMPDGIQYFEVWPTSTVRKILMVRIGQDTPMFDERTLEFVQQ